MRKRDKAKLAKAIARAPGMGACPLAPPRKALSRMNEKWVKFNRMNAAVIAASVDLDKALLLEEDLRMRIAFLENKLIALGYSAD